MLLKRTAILPRRSSFTVGGAVADEGEGAFEAGGQVGAGDEGGFVEEGERGVAAVGGDELDGGVVGVEGDLVHGDALEEGGPAVGAGVAGGFEAVGFELVGDEAGGAFVGFGAGVAALHAVVGESGGEAPPLGRGGGGGLLGLGSGGENCEGEERGALRMKVLRRGWFYDSADLG